MTHPAFNYHHHWIAGDALIWGSRCALNNALRDSHGGGQVTFNRVAVS